MAGVEANITCVEDGNKETTVGTFHATKADGTAFQGTAMKTVVLRNGYTCTSTFDVTGKKL